MSEQQEPRLNESEREPDTELEEVEDEGPRNPFDNPYFLPVALFAFALWFGYDGWFNPSIEAVMFNRVGFPIVLALALYFGWRARQEVRAAREAEERSGADDATP